MMYNLSTPLDLARFDAKVEAVRHKGCAVELTEKTFRTTHQNSYMHLLIGVVAMEVGERMEYVKREYFKKLVNRDLFIIKKQDRFAGEVEQIRSSKELTTEEMRIAIDRFKRWGYENGIYMPNPDDASRLKMIEIEMGRMRQYL